MKIMEILMFPRKRLPETENNNVTKIIKTPPNLLLGTKKNLIYKLK